MEQALLHLPPTLRAPDSPLSSRNLALRWPVLLGIVAAHIFLLGLLWQARTATPARPTSHLVFARMIGNADKAAPALPPAFRQQRLSPQPSSLQASSLSSERPAAPIAVPMAAQADAVSESNTRIQPAAAQTQAQAQENSQGKTQEQLQENAQKAMAMPPHAEPVQLAELRVACPLRPPPVYPSSSRRLHETGRVDLRVQLDEAGRITAARVERSSGFLRLDNAALDAVRNWRCNAPKRDGKPVSAVALQPFNFSLD